MNHLILSFNLSLRMSILCFFMCLPVFIANGHQHQNDVNWDLLDNMGGWSHLIHSFNFSLRMSILGLFWHWIVSFHRKWTPASTWCELGPFRYHGCTYLILSFNLSLKMSIFGVFWHLFVSFHIKWTPESTWCEFRLSR